MKKLFTAVRRGDLETLGRAIEQKPELVHCIAGSTPKKDAGQSLLQVALKTGNLHIAEYLLSKGADVNFMESAECGNPWRAPVVHDAINAAIMSCRWNTYSAETGITVFSTKAEADFAYALLEKMLDLGADVNAMDSYGNTGIWRACIQASQILPQMNRMTGELSSARVFTDELEEDLKRIFGLLLERGADLSYVRPDLNMTVLQLHTNKLFSRLIV